MLRLFYVAGGGALGVLLRYFMYISFEGPLKDSAHYITLFVNVIGPFLIGLLWGLFESANVHEDMRMFLFISAVE